MTDLTTDRRRLLALLLAAGAAPACTSTARAAGPDDNPLLWALAWQQTAAEFDALCYQACQLARLHLEAALAAPRDADRPLAVITDVDATILHAHDYWTRLLRADRAFFDDPVWDDWITEDRLTPVPGTQTLLNWCAGEGVEVFYVTNRNQGEQTDAHVLRQLQQAGFPYADADHLFLFRETSDKTPARRAIAERYDVVVMLGDNLNDFHRDYYVTDVAERRALMERDRADWGSRYILFPNPTDGHWVRAIFGDSEPADTPENRRRLYEAAAGLVERRD